MREHNISRTKFTTMSNEDLDSVVSEIITEHPQVGELMLNGHLRSRDIVVQRKRLREAVKRVNSGSVDSRRRTTISRRVYSVPCPNYIWHVDGNHKLKRWKMVVCGAMDGYSRMLMFLQCTNNNRAETVKQLFSTVVTQFGRPLHIRTELQCSDLGGYAGKQR